MKLICINCYRWQFIIIKTYSQVCIARPGYCSGKFGNRQKKRPLRPGAMRGKLRWGSPRPVERPKRDGPVERLGQVTRRQTIVSRRLYNSLRTPGLGTLSVLLEVIIGGHLLCN
jgi:hypothetical protein